MGGKGSGGYRARAGRKPKTDEERFMAGDAGHRGRVLAHPSAPEPAAVTEFDAPNDLNTDERLVWLELAPFAFKNRTLTEASSLAFRMLCRNIVLERRYGLSVQDCGSANHRGLIQRVEGGLDAFQLRPQGRAMPNAAPAERPANPLDRFLKRA